MDYERYFAPVMEFGRLIQALRESSGEEKKEIARQIRNSDFLTGLRREQTIVELDVLNHMTGGHVKNSRHDFYANMAVPAGRDMEENGMMPYHSHDYLELIYVYRGKYVQYINGIRHQLEAGQFCLLNPNVVHRDAISGQEDVVFFFCLSRIYVQNDLAAAFASHSELKNFMEYQLGHSARQYVHFLPADRQAVEAVLDQILKENHEKLPGHHSIIHGLLVRLFELIVRNGTYRVCCQTPSESREAMVAEMVGYIKENLTESSRSQVAEYFHFNPDYVNRLFVKTFGKCYLDFVRDLKLEKAAGLLLGTELSVHSIIRELGFSNRSYFNRIFREKYGVLPDEYRRENL